MARVRRKERLFAENLGKSLLDLADGELGRARQRMGALKTNFVGEKKYLRRVLRRLGL